MTHGRYAKQVIDAARERGTPVPRVIAEAPVPEDAYQIRVFEAFERLSTCRQIAMGAVGPIPWSVADQYAQRMGIADDQLAYDDFMFIIQQLDETFLHLRGKEIESERKKAASGKSDSLRPPNRRPRPRR